MKKFGLLLAGISLLIGSGYTGWFSGNQIAYAYAEEATDTEQADTEQEGAEMTATEESAVEEDDTEELGTGGGVTEECSEQENSTILLTEELQTEDADSRNATSNITIDAAHFPDANFRTYILDKENGVDANGDGILSVLEIRNCKELNIEKYGIQDLTGIEYFTYLKYLNVSKNALTKIDISKNSKLVDLKCTGNALTALNLKQNTNLETLDCSQNQLTALDVTKNEKLVDLKCTGNALAALTLTENSELEYLDCEGNKLSSLNVSGNKKLLYLICGNNVITTLDLQYNLKLERLSCSLNRLATLDLSRNTALLYLECENNKLTTIGFGNLGKLQFLNCNGNRLKVLDLRKQTKLQYLYCDYNRLSALDLTGNPELAILYCSNNALPYLNLEKNTKLQDFRCEGNTYGIKPDSKRRYNLSKIAGLNIKKLSGINGGTLSGSQVTMDKNATQITYTYDCGNKQSASFTLTVPVSRIRLNQSNLKLQREATYTLKPTITPSMATNRKLKWTSSDSKIATVTSSGRVKGLKAGSVVITCQAMDGSGQKATCRVTVDTYTHTEAFVARLYTEALNRQPDPAGLAYWTQEIQTGKRTPVAVAREFFFSPEFKNKNLSRTEYVKVLYRTFMGREYDKAGLDYWVKRLNSGDSRRNVLNAFAGCPEFQNIIKKFKLN